jgi:hypothetical protein
MVMIVSFELLAYCLVAGAVYLMVIDFILGRVEKFIPGMEHFPKELIETRNGGWYISSFIIEFIFFVFVPSIAYGLFYTIIPFSGIRGGIACALFLALCGILPTSILLIFKIRIPAVFMLYQIFGILIRVMGTLAIIGYLYSL